MRFKKGYLVGVCSVLFTLTIQAQAGIQTNTPARIDPTYDALQAALDRGGLIQFGTNGTIILSTNLNVTKDAIVDATDRSIIIDGGGQTRHFYVHTNVSLTLRRLILTNGYHFEQQQQPGPLGLGRGGSIYSDGAATLEIVDCQFTHNKASGSGALSGVNYRNGFGYGGDIYNNEGRVWITNCSFLASSCDGAAEAAGFQVFSAQGGSIYSMRGDISIGSTTFDHCVASNWPATTVAAGGAIASFSSHGRVFNSRFLNNSSGTVPFASEGFVRNLPGAGGAIFNSGGALTIEHCQFLTNSVPGTLVQGSAIYNDNTGTLACANSFFGHHNVFGPTNLDVYPRLYDSPYDQLGGAIFNGGSASFLDTAFEDNTAAAFIDRSGYGGAIYSSNTLSVLDCAFYHNQASGDVSTYFNSTPPPGSGAGSGGAIFVSQGSAEIRFSTFYENKVAGGRTTINQSGKLLTYVGPALGAALAAGTNAVVKVRANIFANVQSTINFTQLFGTMLDLGFNLSSDASSQLTSGTSLPNTNPKLGTYGLYGGATPTFPLLPGSPAIDGGPTNDVPPFDQRGAPRWVGKATDIGSYEVLANGELVLAGASPGYNLFFPFNTSQNWTIQTSTNLIVWEMYNAAITNQPGFISATIDDLSGTHFFRAVGK